jgi:hypothetical protein
MKALFEENNFGDIRFLTSIMTYTPSDYFEDNTGKSCLSTISRIFNTPPTLSLLKKLNFSVGFTKYHTIRIESTDEGYHAIFTYHQNDLGFD